MPTPYGVAAMDYKAIYDDFIDSRRMIESSTINLSYYEIHHIVPRSLGGSDDKSNLIALTIRDHIFAHALLAKAFGGSMWYAYWMMTNGAASARAKKLGILVRVSSNAAAIARNGRSKQMSERMSGENHHNFGIARSDDVKRKISESLKEKHEMGYISPNKGRKLTEEQKVKVREGLKIYYENGGSPWMKGKKHSKETRLKISLAQTGERHRLYGKKMPREQAMKIGLSQTGLKNHSADHSIYIFRHICGEVFTGYRTDFIKKYGLCKANIGRLVKGTQKQHKGWSMEKIKNDSTS